MGRPKLTNEEKAERLAAKMGGEPAGSPKEEIQRAIVSEDKKNGPEKPGKLKGIWEVKRIGTYGFVFAAFDAGIQFWVEFSKPTNRLEVIDLFDAHVEQRPWRMGSMDNNRRIPVWVWDKVEGLEFYHFKECKVVSVKDIERVRNETRSKETGRDFFEFYVIPEKGERVLFRLGEGLFGKMKKSQTVPNVQDIKADAVRALWPSRTMRLDSLMKGTVFENMSMKPVTVPVDNSPTRSGEVFAPEGTKIAGVKSGQLDRPIVGTFNPESVSAK